MFKDDLLRLILKILVMIMLHTKLLESLILIIFYIYTILNILEAEDLFN